MQRVLGTTALALLLAASGTGFAQAQDACGTAPLDTDANGAIDADEQQAYDLGVYSGVDYNGDGIVSRQEHCFDPGAVEPAAGPPVAPDIDGQSPIERTAQMHFGMFDSDNDGRISRAEWLGVEADPDNFGWGVEARFDELDADIDDFLSEQEFFADNDMFDDSQLPRRFQDSDVDEGAL